MVLTLRGFGFALAPWMVSSTLVFGTLHQVYMRFVWSFHTCLWIFTCYHCPTCCFVLGANQVDVPLTLDVVIHTLILDTIHQVYVCFIWNMHIQV